MKVAPPMRLPGACVGRPRLLQDLPDQAARALVKLKRTAPTGRESPYQPTLTVMKQGA
jgi:hypothetical protein